MKRLTGLMGLLVLCMYMNAAANDNFDAAMQAAAARNYPAALDKFEAALRQEPNNLRFGNEYRQTAIAARAYDRCILFFEKLVTDHPKAPNAWMNYGYAYVDKIPVEGAITQVLLANKALGYFSSALDLEDTWLARYTRGNSYVFWPAIFGRTPLAIADLEKAVAIADKSRQKNHHVRAWIALGDCYWRLDNLDKAREIWRKTLDRFPGDAGLKKRLELQGDALNAYMADVYDPGRRVDTNLRILWEE